MTRVIAESIYQRLSEKAFLYDCTIAPVVEKYESIVSVLSVVIVVLLVIGVILLIMYKSKSSECKFYKQCLNANFSWWKNEK